MKPLSVVISIYDGLVQDVFASDSNIEVTLVDWDVEEADFDHPHVVEFTNDFGGLERAYVAPVEVQPFGDLVGTDVAAAVEAAESAHCRL